MTEGELVAPLPVEDVPVILQEESAPDILTQDVGAELRAVVTATTTWPRPERYRDLTSEMLARCTIGALIAYSRAAQSNKDWEAVAMLQEKIVRLEPRNIRAHLFLSFALENIGQFEEAARVWETLMALPGYEPNPRYANRLAELRVRAAYPRGGRTIRYDLPSSQAEVTPDTLARCNPADLIRYSIQAQKDEQWSRVEMFQWELVKRQPRNLVAHILLVRAFIMQGKMEDAEGLMQTVEELRSPHDDSRTEKAILSLRYRLRAAAVRAKPRPGEPMTNPAPVAAPPVAAPSPARNPMADFLPVPKKPSNIDTSRFDNFLTSIRREAESWSQADGQGEGWRKIPEDERAFFVEAFGEFQKQLMRAIPKGPNKAFWGKFDDIGTQIHRGALNIHALGTLIDRTENTARGTRVNLEKLEPIRLKERG